MFEFDPIDDDEMNMMMLYEMNDTNRFNFTTAVEEIETGWAETVADTIWNGFEYLKKSLFGSDDGEEYEAYKETVGGDFDDSMRLNETLV